MRYICRVNIHRCYKEILLVGTIIVCILAGLGAGLGTGFAGMSAAVVITPMLIVFLDMNAFEAIGIALAADVLASAMSAFNYGRSKNIDIKGSMWLFISVLVFTLVGALMSHYIGEATIGSATVYVSFVMGVNFLVKSYRTPKQHTLHQPQGRLRIVLSILCGTAIGFVCGFVGAGGGIMMLLLLTGVLGYELKTAVGTSVFIMTFTALFGATSHFVLLSSWPNLTVLLVCVISTLVFAGIGSKIANKASTKMLNRLTGIVLTLLGIAMIIVDAIGG